MDHHSQHAVLNAGILAMVVLMVVPSLWLLLCELGRLIREDEQARAKAGANLDEMFSVSAVKVKKAKVPERQE